jgi:tRNA dimethylallyltransferase
MPANIYFITGPTAIGKSRVAMALAKKIGGEIVSADSMQVYRHMDIGTAKPSAADRRAIVHHMLDVADPDEDFSVMRYQTMAHGALEEIRRRGHTPIVVGGSGFYVNALLFETQFTPTPFDPSLRAALQAAASEKGTDFLHEQLRRVDPDAADAIHPNNVKRVIRALEYFEQTGVRFSAHNKLEKTRAPVSGARVCILHAPREKLYARINRRVEEMFAAGLAEEVRALLAMGYQETLPALQSIGYNETSAYERAAYTLAEATQSNGRATRQYAKRQLTWLRHRCLSGEWIDIDECDIRGIIEEIEFKREL